LNKGDIMNKVDLLENSKPILFNSEMVKAILDGRKTQTCSAVMSHIDINNECDFIKSKYKKGDVLWVRESVGTRRFAPYDKLYFWYVSDERDKGVSNHSISIPKRFDHEPKWILNENKVPNGCIKEMARIFLKVTDISVERLQDITIKGIFKEGFNGEISDYFISDKYHQKAIEKCFSDNQQDITTWWVKLWNSTSKDGYKWDKNPYVFVYEFERMEG